MLDKTENIGQVIFSMESLPFFLKKICVFINLLVPKKCPYKFYSIGKNRFWNLVYCLSSFVTLDKTKKRTDTNIFFSEKLAFFQKFVFSTTF